MRGIVKFIILCLLSVIVAGTGACGTNNNSDNKLGISQYNSIELMTNHELYYSTEEGHGFPCTIYFDASLKKNCFKYGRIYSTFEIKGDQIKFDEIQLEPTPTKQDLTEQEEIIASVLYNAEKLEVLEIGHPCIRIGDNLGEKYMVLSKSK